MIASKKSVGVFSGGYAESLIIKSILESHKIVVYVGNSIKDALYPIGITIGTFTTIQLQVHEADFVKARHILEIFNDNLYNLEV